MIFLRVLLKNFLWLHYSGAPGARGPRFIEPPEPPVPTPLGDKHSHSCTIQVLAARSRTAWSGSIRTGASDGSSSHATAIAAIRTPLIRGGLQCMIDANLRRRNIFHSIFHSTTTGWHKCHPATKTCHPVTEIFGLLSEWVNIFVHGAKKQRVTRRRSLSQTYDWSKSLGEKLPSVQHSVINKYHPISSIISCMSACVLFAFRNGTSHCVLQSRFRNRLGKVIIV